MSDRRIEWIRAQLDATEAHAKKDLWAADQATTGEWVALYGHNMPSAIEADGVRIADVVSDADALLMARFKPETVRRRAEEALADVEAKRALLEQFRLRGDSVRSVVQPSTGGVWDDLIRMLAEGFRHRPGYAEACGE